MNSGTDPQLSNDSAVSKSEYFRVEDLVQNMSNGVLLFNERREIVVANEHITSLLEVAPESLTLSTVLDSVVPDTDSDQALKEPYQFVGETRPGMWNWLTMAEAVDQVISAGNQIHFNSVKLRNRYFEMFISPVGSMQSENHGGAIVLHDITQMKEVDRMKTEFVSVASHQLRTPLTAIRLFVEMLANEDVGPLNESQKEYVDNVYVSVERMIGLVNDFLNVSRLETGTLKVEPEMVFMEEVVAATVKDAQPLATEHGCTLTFLQEGETSYRLPVDVSLMHQVVHNLVTNAIRYSQGEDRAVEVEVLAVENPIKAGYEQAYAFASGCVVVKVRDHGIGIPEEQQKHLFDKFFRADNAVKTESEGSGLGLYIVKLILDSAGGKIWLETEEGKGTTFYVAVSKYGMSEKMGEKGLAK